MSSTVQALLSRFDSEAPLSRARTIPAAWYNDPGIYELERKNVFGHAWVAIGRVDQLPEPGSYFTAEVAGEPIVVVRGEDREVRAFFNVCRHRAARVMNEECGVASKLRCRYHGWTYDLAGQLRGVPEFDGVEDFSREKNGLQPVAVAAWGPLLFVSLDGKAVPLDEFLAPMPEALASSVPGLGFYQRKSYVMDCNWKVFIDNYLDGGYHVNTVHPGLAGVLDYSEYRTALHAHSSVQTAPLKAPPPNRDDGVTAGVRKGGRAQYWWVFPNLMVNVYDGIMDVNICWPLGPNKCRVDFDFYFADRIDSAARAQSVEVAGRIQDEDMSVCAEVHAGLHSRCYDTGRFSVKREMAGHHFQRMLAARLRSV